MGDRISDVIRGIGPTNVAPVTPYEAVVANTATTYPQDVFVTIPSIDQGRTLKGAVRWTPIPGPNGTLIYPTKDDIAQVVRTQEGYYWMTAFIPAAFPSDPRRQKYSLTGLSQVDMPVDGEAAGMVICRFRYITSGIQDVYIRPNASATGLLEVFDYSLGTAAPNGNTHSTNFNTPIPGARLNWNGGAGTGKTIVVGEALVYTKRNGTRRLIKVDASFTNNVGSGNMYYTDWRAGVVYDDSVGIVSSLRIICASGTFDDGHVIVEQTGR
jgi:hypothetical protein